MPSDKDRLYVALYARGGAPTMPGKEDTYHWALIVGPKIEGQGKTGVRYHAREKMKTGGSEWVFEERECSLAPTNMLLVRVIVGKVTNKDSLVQILRSTPIRQNQAGWNCVAWVREALQRLRADGTALGTSVIEWETVRAAAMSYCQKKKDQHRFDGQGNFDLRKAPTYDLIEQRETMA
ncbi:hypothetical protein ASPFODRAFT_64201 [Aspergillus luchuensis CBS 106.47]|uniref:Uncharacterized protein n=1 Tax=Aspergillus luchuensis (strain CBS 106.47) TaxID=1137211 RepID=A0A1M3T5Z3_ASPLC|nr:hypothetical protein ASPFODRAFT_64201 [Aspergillus luchuensis CBS 106.47]